MSIKFIIQIFLDTDYMFPPNVINHEWVITRIKLFIRYTLKSILNQSFADFRVLLLCSKQRAAMIRSHILEPKVEIIDDLGESIYTNEIDTDYVSITRIDSDDIFHRDAMKLIRDNQLQTTKRECLVFRKCYRWDTVNKYLGSYHRTAPPFYTHIFPKLFYKNWNIMLSQHFKVHGKAGGNLPETIELPEFKICIIKHHDNHTRIKASAGGRLRPPISKSDRKINEFMEFDIDKISEKLKNFGLSNGDIRFAHRYSERRGIEINDKTT